MNLVLSFSGAKSLSAADTLSSSALSPRAAPSHGSALCETLFLEMRCVPPRETRALVAARFSSQKDTVDVLVVRVALQETICNKNMLSKARDVPGARRLALAARAKKSEMKRNKRDHLDAFILSWSSCLYNTERAILCRHR